MIFYRISDQTRHNTNMMKRMHIDINALPDDYVILSNAYPASFNSTYHTVADIGESNVNGIWTITYDIIDKNLDDVKKDLKSYVATIRYEEEISGIQFETNNIDTSRGSQSMILGMYTSSATWTIGKTIKFKTSDGWVTYNVIQIDNLATMISDHVQNCFTAESIVSSEIDAATESVDLMAIDLNTSFTTALI